MTSEPEHPSYSTRSSELLWAPRDQPARGPKPGLTLDQIVDAAISVADTDGFNALSMRRVARELGVGTMSLYRYVPGKSELLDLMLDKISDPGDGIKKAAELDWRGVLELAARGSYQLYTTHSWLMQINWARPVFGPNTLAGVELIVAGLDGTGLTDQERVMVLSVLDGYVVGVARGFVQYTTAAEETGVSDEEFWSQQYPVLEQAMATGNYPAMASMGEDAFEGGWKETFEFGLARLLDGLDLFVKSRH
jgi:AcrR family transcriptional regulator